MKREKYSTVTKILVLHEVKQFKRNFTAKDVKERLSGVGLTTIYRCLEELSNNGVLKKYYNDSNVANFEYLEECDEKNHFYLKCIKCGMTKHVDCDCITDFSEHILKEHGFHLMDNNLFITGICKECFDKNE